MARRRNFSCHVAYISEGGSFPCCPVSLVFGTPTIKNRRNGNIPPRPSEQTARGSPETLMMLPWYHAPFVEWRAFCKIRPSQPKNPATWGFLQNALEIMHYSPLL